MNGFCQSIVHFVGCRGALLGQLMLSYPFPKLYAPKKRIRSITQIHQTGLTYKYRSICMVSSYWTTQSVHPINGFDIGKFRNSPRLIQLASPSCTTKHDGGYTSFYLLPPSQFPHRLTFIPYIKNHNRFALISKILYVTNKNTEFRVTAENSHPCLRSVDTTQYVLVTTSNQCKNAAKSTHFDSMLFFECGLSSSKQLTALLIHTVFHNILYSIYIYIYIYTEYSQAGKWLWYKTTATLE